MASLKKIAKKIGNVAVAATVGGLTGGSVGIVAAAGRQAVRESETSKPTALNLRSVGQSAVTGVVAQTAVVAAKVAAPAVAGLVKGGGALPALKKLGGKLAGAKMPKVEGAGEFLNDSVKAVGGAARGRGESAVAAETARAVDRVSRPRRDGSAPSTPVIVNTPGDGSGSGAPVTVVNTPAGGGGGGLGEMLPLVLGGVALFLAFKKSS